MRNYFIVVIAVLFHLSVCAQIGINTNVPESTLDIRVNDPAAPTSEAGIAIPQVMMVPSTGNRVGQIVINMSDTIFTYYDGTRWLPIYNQVNFIGDLKHGLQVEDHGGWVKLDGRSVGSLSSNQKASALELGFLDFLPNAEQLVYKSDNALALGQIDGNNAITITQANLPSIILPGVTESDGLHSHSIRTRQDDWSVSGGPASGRPSYGTDNGVLQITNTTMSSGDHTHIVNIPLGGLDVPISINPMFLNSNSFIFLGN